MSSQRLEGSDLEELLARVRSDYGDAATITEANKVRRGGVGGFFAKESFEVIVDIPDDDGAPVFEPVDEEEPFVPFTVEDLASSIEDPPPSFASTPDPAPSFSEVLGKAIEAERKAALEPAWPATAALAEAAPAARIVGPRFEPGTDGGSRLTGMRIPASGGLGGGLSSADLRALAALGLPTDRAALAASTDDPAAVALVRVLSEFPTAPALPSGASAVIAVVGERERARELAATLAGDASLVVVAGRHRSADIRCDADVLDLQGRWRRRKRPTVVAIDATFGVGPAPWAAGILDALGPTLVLAHVDAGRKSEDIVAWSESLGGVDALAVVGIDRTTTPAAVLRTGIPVASLDGEVATPARWAALLTDRLTLAA